MKRTTSTVCGALEASVGTRRPVMTMAAGAVNQKPRALVEKVLFCGGSGRFRPAVSSRRCQKYAAARRGLPR